jgi:beta-lactamase superfamily II metal-dependent hydrolase
MTRYPGGEIEMQRVYVSDTVKYQLTISPVNPDHEKRTVIWGDSLDVTQDATDPAGWIVHWKRFDAKTGIVSIREYRIKKDKCQNDALLEMIFLDVGQGDGCIVSLPDGNAQKVMLIDAGEGSNMHRFLKWRFRYIDGTGQFHAAVITHSDSDHYAGFQRIFDDKNLKFDHIYHNGLLERGRTDGQGIIGPVAMDANPVKRCLQIFETHQQVDAFYSVVANRTNIKDGKISEKLYPKLFFTALADPTRFGDIDMLSVRHGDQVGGKAWLPGFVPAVNKPSVEILGPVPITDGSGALTLPAFGNAPRDDAYNVGKTKNGNSVLMKLNYKKLNVIFGGDLNKPAEDYLLRHYGEISDAAALKTAIPKAKIRLAADLLKCCHHGSADVTDEFVAAVKPFAFVVSSGDEESHVHPRPEIIGMLGRNGRGDRPMVLSTELLRSTPESFRLTKGHAAEVKDLETERDAALVANDKARLTKARKALKEFWDARFRRLVNVYGAITVRSNGEKLLIAFRKEVATGSPWQLYAFEYKQRDWQGQELTKDSH